MIQNFQKNGMLKYQLWNRIYYIKDIYEIFKYRPTLNKFIIIGHIYKIY